MNNSKYNRKGTQSSSFGTPGRINHNSSKFYKSKLYHGRLVDNQVQYIENEIPEDRINKIYCKSSESMDDIPDNSIHLMITSPLTMYKRFMMMI